MAGLSVQQWEKWRPPGPRPMQVVGELDSSVYEQLSEAGWGWTTHEEESASDEYREYHLARLSEAEQAPFPLFGLSSEFDGTRELNGLGRRGGEHEVVSHVTLSHGLGTHTRVDVTVTGPLTGRTTGGTWSMDPLPMIAAELLNRTGVRFASGDEPMKATQNLLGRGFENGEILVDGERWPFRFLRDDPHWAALNELQPHHVLYVVASNVAPTEIELTRLDDLTAYG